MKRLLFYVLVLIVGGLALQPAPVRAQESSSCTNAPVRAFNFRQGWDVVVAVSDDDPRPNNLRERPWPTARVVMQIPVGDQMVLTGESVCSHGLRWWPIAILKNGVTTYGWTVDGEGATYYLELVSQTNLSVTPTPTSTPRVTATPAPATATPASASLAESCSLAPLRTIIVHTWARVVSEEGRSSNFRRDPGLSTTIITEVPVGTAVYVVAGPRCADGYRWWRVRYNNMLGWVGDGVRENGISIPYLEPAPVQSQG